MKTIKTFLPTALTMMPKAKPLPGFFLRAAVILLCGICPVLGADLKVLPGHVPKVISSLAPKGRLAATNKLWLAIGLPLRDQAGLSKLLQEIYDPSSPNYHHYLTAAQFADRFGPAAADYETLKAFAMSNNLAVTGTHPNRTLLDVEGSVSDVEKALHVTMRVYRHPTEQRDFYAPDTEPSIDLNLPVLHISGLDNFRMPHPLIRRMTSLDQPAGASSPSGSGPGSNYLGRDFRAAYAPGVTLTGAGQTVGLLEFDSGFFQSDITAYEDLAGLPNVPISAVLLDGYNGGPGAANDEVSLDIEMAIAMAPGLAGVIVYEGTNADDILNRMATDNLARQISASWANYADANSDSIFLQYATQGQSFFNGSGDGDAWVGTIGPPCDDPNITIVGGTTLSTSGPGGPWATEKVWNWGYDPPGWPGTANGYWGDGGGISTVWPIPSWQTGINMANNHGSTTMRNVPDVALTADNIWVTYSNGLADSFGGTSAAAPLWAGFTALVNQQAAAGGQSPVGFLNPILYAIGKGTSCASCFHDIVIGSNTWTNSPTNFFAVPGYDLCAGWGTPTGSNLINALANGDLICLCPSNIVVTSCRSLLVYYSVTATSPACSPVNVICTPPSGSLFAPGTVTTVNCSAVDSCRHSCTCSFTVTVTMPPPLAVVCPTNKTVRCGSSWTFDLPSVSSGANVTILSIGTVTNGDCPQLITQTWLIADACGNSTNCSQTVTVEDTGTPRMPAPNNILVRACTNVQVFYTRTADSACWGNIPVVCTPPSGSYFAPGATTVNCVATDRCGNTASNSFTVTVQCDYISTTIVNAFDPSYQGQLNYEGTVPLGCGVWFGGSTVVWDDTMDSTGNGGGSMYVTASFNSGIYTPIIADYICFPPWDNEWYNGGENVDLSQYLYSAVQFDILWDNTSSLTIDEFNDLSLVQSGLSGSTPGLEIENVYGSSPSNGNVPLGNITIPEAAARNWVTVTLPINQALPNLAGTSGILLWKWVNNEGDLPGSTTANFWIDNVKFVEGLPAPPPPPTLNPPTKPTPGLNVTASTESAGNGFYWDRQSVMLVVTNGLSWVENTANGPVTYAFTINAFPQSPATHGCEAYLFLVPNPAYPGDNAPDWNETNCVIVQLQQGAGTTTMYFQYKVNAPNGNDYNTLGSVTHTGTALGTWAVRFTSDTDVALIAPDGTTANLVIPPGDAGIFAEVGDPGFHVYLGMEANNAASINQAVCYSQFAVTGAPAGTISDNFLTDGVLNANIWDNSVAAAPAGVFIMPANAAYWISWTTPATGFVLQSAPALSGPWTMQTNDFILNGVGIQSQLLLNTDLPPGPNAFFRMIQQ